jgi:hypothetical protein
MASCCRSPRSGLVGTGCSRGGGRAGADRRSGCLVWMFCGFLLAGGQRRSQWQLSPLGRRCDVIDGLFNQGWRLFKQQHRQFEWQRRLFKDLDTATLNLEDLHDHELHNKTKTSERHTVEVPAGLQKLYTISVASTATRAPGWRAAWVSHGPISLPSVSRISCCASMAILRPN